MRSVTVRLEDLKTTVLNLGFVGENEHTQIRIDSKKMFDQYPTASASLTVCPPRGEGYPATIERDGDFVLWTVTDSDLINEGSGEIQLSFTVSETIAKSYIGRTKVSRSIIPTGQVPTPIENWMEEASETLEDVQQALEDIPETVQTAVDGMIDDTAGHGVTNKVWSAGKTYDQINLKADKANPVFTGTFNFGRRANTTVGQVSATMGGGCEASGDWSFASNYFTKASGDRSHAEGMNSRAEGMASHAENAAVAKGQYAHAENFQTGAYGNNSHSEGNGTIAQGKDQHVSGRYNIVDNNNQYAEIIGNGSLLDGESNARSLDWDGNEYLMGDVYVGCGTDSTGGTKVAKITDIPDVSGKIDATEKGVANGVATLGGDGKVPSAQLPSYVDDVVEYASLSAFPVTGESGKIYVALDTNLTYRWSGSAYVEISPSLALGETESTAYRGDRGKVAYDHAVLKGSAFASGFYKITTNAEGHVTAVSAVTKSDITALGICGEEVATTVETQAIIDEWEVSA